MYLPPRLESIFQPLFDVLPLDAAMTQLVVTQGAPPDRIKLISAIVQQPEVGPHSPLAAGLWLYIDKLHRSHEVSQSDESQTGAYWHGIMHRREGDFSNSHYWLRRAGAHPAMKNLPGYDGHQFIDDVEAGYKTCPEPLVLRQQAEWANLFEWCALQE